MKYIVFLTPFGSVSREMPVIFPNSLVHADVSKNFLAILPKGSKPISAGECNCFMECSGRSETLNLESRGAEDTSLLFMVDYGGGIK